ncbi:MAG: CaiB/BaiF CoA-transferase family protein [Betaproteobacteria bacterium]
MTQTQTPLPTPTPGALTGARLIEMGQLIAAPFAGKMLGEFGAEVVKIEPPAAGDPLRNGRMLKDGTSVWWQVSSRNKRSVALDLLAEVGQDIARRLVCEADVLIENFRPGTLEGWGLGWDELSTGNPGLIMLRISGYGQTGPYRDLPGFGVIGEAMGGLRHLTGEPGRVPVRVGVSIGDTLAALHGIIGVLAALGSARVPAGKVCIAKDIHEDPHLRARDMILRQRTRERYELDVPGIVPKLSATPGSVRSAAPRLGKKTATVLAGIGLTAADVAELRATGVVR